MTYEKESISNRGLRGLLERYTRHRLQIDHRGSHIAVAEQLLDRLDVVVGQQEMACECVPKCMRRNALGYACLRSRLLDGALDVGIMVMIPPLLAGTRH